MLTLSRRHGESVRITTPSGEVITVWVDLERARGNKVRLSFDCDPGVRIWRTELLPVTERERDGDQ